VNVPAGAVFGVYVPASVCEELADIVAQGIREAVYRDGRPFSDETLAVVGTMRAFATERRAWVATHVATSCPDGSRPQTMPTMTTEFTTAEAADALGITTAAVAKRLRAKNPTLEGRKDGHRWLVRL
jgi:hypothetical protein